uniref:HDC14600 n=1 Tax=Drosophila melanogaster TaxID=7227 RepID=Q6IJM8_DROME|nr:TPA_inf: HDC14600 [Drosophila melanogaster]
MFCNPFRCINKDEEDDDDEQEDDDDEQEEEDDEDEEEDDDDEETDKKCSHQNDMETDLVEKSTEARAKIVGDKLNYI